MLFFIQKIFQHTQSECQNGDAKLQRRRIDVEAGLPPLACRENAIMTLL